MTQILSLRKVTKTYGKEQIVRALDSVDLSFVKGELTVIIGQSGSGKSTLLNMISGIDRPTEGEILFGNEKLHQYSEAELTRWRGKNIGIVFQFFQLIPTLTVLENVMLPMDFSRKHAAKDRKTLAFLLLESTGIVEHADRLPSQLSGGQQQRAAIARALANQAPILIADEPTGNLDSFTAESIVCLFRELSANGTTVIVVTHNKELAKSADRVITIHDGRIISDSSDGSDTSDGRVN